jgi:DNA modification methylase
MGVPGNGGARGGNGYPIARDLRPALIPLASCKPLGRDTRKHSPAQVRKIAAVIGRFGLVAPIVTDPDRRVIAGWGVVLAARQLGLDEVPAVCITDLSEAELRALRIGLNRLAEDAVWDREALALEFSEISALEPHLLELVGFEVAEIDIALDGEVFDEEDDLPPVDAATVPVARLGDLWMLGEHRLYCGDALVADAYARLLGVDKATMVFTDPPYNVPIAGHVSGRGKAKHRDFVMASNELSESEFKSFLRTSLGNAASSSVDGAIHFVCMDWRGMAAILAAGTEVYSEFKNLCVWNKNNDGMGSLYRSKHELVFVFKVGKGAHINNVCLGRYGRSRSNVWEYPSQNALKTTKSKLGLHPTVKPVALVADAIRDCSNRGSIILDPFGGAGTTLIAAARTGRRARLIELNPTFVDVTIARWQRLTGGTAMNAGTGLPFAQSDRTDFAAPDASSSTSVENS